jgi:hypothetical protein
MSLFMGKGVEMDLKTVIQSQYFASLAMLKQAIVKCPPSVWDAPQDQDKAWYKAYHALYYTHKYLQIDHKHFVPWKKYKNPDRQKPISKEEALEYLAFIEQQVAERIPETDLDADAGFLGNRFNKMELQFTNIRHIQQHTGELYERLGNREDTKLDWAEQRHNKVKK